MPNIFPNNLPLYTSTLKFQSTRGKNGRRPQLYKVPAYPDTLIWLQISLMQLQAKIVAISR